METQVATRLPPREMTEDYLRTANDRNTPHEFEYDIKVKATKDGQEIETVANFYRFEKGTYELSGVCGYRVTYRYTPDPNWVPKS
jgi:hypothetical protein